MTDPVTPLIIPIVTYERVPQRFGGELRLHVRSFMPNSDTIVREIPETIGYGDDGREFIAKTLREALNVSQDIILAPVDHRAPHEDLLRAIASPDRVHRGAGLVSFELDTYRGTIAAHYFADGAIEVIEFVSTSERLFGVTVIENIRIQDRISLRLPAPPAALDAEYDDLVASFRDLVNPMIEDRFVLGEDDPHFDDQDPDFIAGSHAGLTELVTGLVLSWHGANGADSLGGVIYYRGLCPGLEERAGVSKPDCEGLAGAPDSLWRAIQAAFDDNRFNAWTVDYNDGLANRVSGWDREEDLIAILVDPNDLSAHERLAFLSGGQDKLRVWLAAKGFSETDIAEICGSKA